jgi:hypothetical protein
MATNGSDGRQKIVVSPSSGLRRGAGGCSRSFGLGSGFMTAEKYERGEKTLQQK